MKFLRYAVAAALLCSPMLTPAAARACDAATLFAKMRAATGGSGWSAVREISAFGSATTSGLTGTARLDDDLGQGRYAQYYRVPVQGSSAFVYDGTTRWTQDISGGVHPTDSAFPREQAVTDAYLTRRAYLTTTSDATFTCTGTRVEEGRTLTLIRVVPRGGIPADLAIDAKTHLLASVSERLPLTTQITSYADYRKAGELLLPFSISTTTALDPADAMVVHVDRYRLERAVSDADFRKPVAENPALMIGSKTSTTVPITLEEGELIVWASLNGRTPLPFILDTGGHEILTTQAAKTLGLRGAGSGQTDGSGPGAIAVQYANVDSVRIGDAELRSQHFLIIPYGYSFYERGRKTPLAGIIGLEFFERYATRIDYAARRLTFTPLRSFHYHGNGTPVRFQFQEDMPMVHAAADEHEALFGTDTGNSGNLILFGHYLANSGLATRYTGGYTVQGHGTGGNNSGHVETLRRFTLGGHELRDITAVFTNMPSGSFASWTEGGNIGYRVLSRFIPVYDYASETLYLEPSPHAPPLDKNRSGLAIVKNGPNAFDVSLVRPGSAAAAAGIRAGDHILAIDGTGAAELSRVDFAGIVGRPAGTHLQMRVQHATQIRNVTLVLR